MTAQKMNHTPSVCKKEYLMPQFFNIPPKELNELSNKKKFRDFMNIIAKN